jgi:hypothetical protein
LKKKNKKTHREFITHAPLFWLIICLIIFGIGILIDSKFTEIIAILLLGGTFSHFIFDSIEYGIRWLDPFYKKQLSLFKTKIVEETVNDEGEKLVMGSISYYWNNIKKSYLKSVTIYFEIAVVIIAIFIYLLS